VIAVTVIIPVYRSQATVAAALESVLAQTRQADEVIVVDSSPDDATAQVVERFVSRGVTFIRSATRLYPHEARNLGAACAHGNLFVFTDPDIVARPDWLSWIESAYEATGQAIVGSVDCYGRRWTDLGVHLCKFDSWLPGGPSRPVEIGPSINFAVPRAWFEATGGFPGDPMLGDTTFSWALVEAGHGLWHESRAVVAHHHTQDVPSLFRERYSRGREFASIRMQYHQWSDLHILLWWFISIKPLRLTKLMVRRVSHCAAAGWLGWLSLTWPIVLIGEAGWVWGESAAYWARLRRRS
jgi:glycosyltransferase involved in cell wall biosynthesis